MSAVSEADARSFVCARPWLLRVARRVLVNPVDADDIVQDTWMRWQETDRERVRDPTAFLTTTATRLALNLGQSARARREASAGSWPSDAVDPGADPARGAERGADAEQALRALLERLTESELAVYVLREAFDYPHRRIAQVLGLGEANVRQLVTRARRRLTGDARRTVDPVAHRRLADAFRAAARTGELGALENLLAASGACAPR